MSYLYILLCGDGSLYTGQTDALTIRKAQHKLFHGCEYTRRRQPVRLVYQQAFPTREKALVMERRVKKWTRAKKEALIRGDWDALRAAARRGARQGPAGS